MKKTLSVLLAIIMVISMTIMAYAIDEPSTTVVGGVTYYQLGTAEDLYWFADKVNNDNDNFKDANAILTADIVVNEDMEAENLREWIPIGRTEGEFINDTWTTIHFNGIFDGNQHTISGLYSNNLEYSGLVGSNSGTIKNVGIINSYFYSTLQDASIGSIAALNRGTVSCCWFEGTIGASGADTYVGGVVGINYKNVDNCYNTGTVTNDYDGVGTTSFGGVVGHSLGGTIEYCHNVGDVRLDGETKACRMGAVIGSNISLTWEGTTVISKAYHIYSNNTDLAPIGLSTGGLSVTEDVEYCDDKTFASGDIAYMLNGNSLDGVWGQTVGTDPYPMLFKDLLLPHKHTEEEIQAVESTCTETGLTAGVKCSECDEILVEQEEIDALGHDYEAVETPPTTASQGYTTYTCSRCGDIYVSDYVDPLPAPDFTFKIRTPWISKVRYKDTLVLHTEIDGELPDGATILWTSDNENFVINEINNGKSLEVTANLNGYTVFTATVYDADGNELATDEVGTFSKANFFAKIGGFFRSVFGSTLYHNY